MKHAWITYEGLPVCKRCGMVRRKDGGNDHKACPGNLRVELRDDSCNQAEQGER